MRVCEIDGCERKHMGLGLCQTHYVRMRRTGDPLGSNRGELSKRYNAVHWRLTKLRGPASDLTCRCGAPAIGWAYDHSDPNEIVEVRGGYQMPLSLDPDRYEALCVSCHSEQDHRASHGAPRREMPRTWGQFRCGSVRTKGRGVCQVIVPAPGGRCGWHRLRPLLELGS